MSRDRGPGKVFIPLPSGSSVGFGRETHHSGRETREHSFAFIAKYDGQCPRCSKRIHAGDDVRFVDDYGGVCHDGCHDIDCPTKQPSYKVKGARKPALCPDCHMEHAGECM